MQQRFTDKVAFITGGATGFGRAFAQSLSAEGAAIAIADIDVPAARATAARMAGSGAEVMAVDCDVADAESIDAAVAKAVERFGGVDVLINNAARHHRKYAKGFSSLSRDEIEGLFAVNVVGMVHCSLACRASMRERGDGVILNMASSAGFTSRTPYGVTKVAVRGLTIALASEFGPDGIRVNSIAPTMTETESVLEEYTSDEIDQLVATQFIRRRATMADVCGAMMYLCSKEAAMVTGETVRVTGGTGLCV